MDKPIKTGIIIMSLCEAAIGVLLFINPTGFTRGIIVFVGIALFVLGVSSVVKYFRTSPPAVAAAEHGLTSGILEILAGLFCVIRGEWFILAFPILTVVYGIGILISGAAKVQITVDMLRMKADRWYLALISAVITVVCAVIILCNPFDATTVLWRFTAVTLIVQAVVDIITAILAKSTLVP